MFQIYFLSVCFHQKRPLDRAKNEGIDRLLSAKSGLKNGRHLIIVFTVSPSVFVVGSLEKVDLDVAESHLWESGGPDRHTT